MVVELAEVASLFAIFCHEGFGSLGRGTPVTKIPSFVICAGRTKGLVLTCWFGSGVRHI